MAVLESNQTVSNNRNGFDKEIHKSARTMMLDNIQNFIYQKPIPSCVRETVSNCVDATNEKLVAIQILKGELDVKDVYKTMNDVEVSKEEDNIYADSEFQRDYYDPHWLSSSNRIEIKYTSNTVLGERDMFSISDNGVGIGGKRLEGIFSLGFSTKRLNANELGGFGIGQKSALATGVASYRMTSRHNGKEFKFDIFSHKIENVNSKWAENGEPNPYIEFENTMVDSGKFKSEQQADGTFLEVPIKEPFKAFYTPTTQKNGTSIEFEVKPHNKNQFIDAVKSQLMYLKDDIKFTMVDMYGRSQDIPFKTTPFFETDDVILSDYGHYNRPHFVIKGIAYGIIDFAEAELSPKFGNIGFKFKMEDLDVVPSRESVRYTPKTTEAITKLYARIKSTVATMIQGELNEDKFYPWLKVANKLANRAGNGNSNDPLSRLSSLVDQSDMDLEFVKGIKYNSSFKTMFGPLFTLQTISTSYNNKISRDIVDYTTAMSDAYFQFGTSSSRTTAYLMVTKPNFSVFRVNKNFSYLTPIFKDYVDKKYTDVNEFLKDCESLVNENEVDDTKRKAIKEYLPKAGLIMSYLVKDDLMPSYDNVVVPDDFTVSEEVAESEVNDKLDAERQKQIQRERRANREFHIQNFVLKSTWTNESKLSRNLVKFTDLDEMVNNGKELVYFTEDSDSEVVYAVEHIPISTGVNPLNSDNLMIFKIAKSNVNQVKAIAKPIEEWFWNIKDGVLQLAPMIRAIINRNESFLRSKSWTFATDSINEGIHKKLNKLEKITKDAPKVHIANLGNKIKAIVALNKAILEYQEDYEAEPISEAIMKFNTDYELTEDVIRIDILDKNILQLSEECRDFEKVYGKFLEHVDIKHIPEELELIMQAKKDQLKFKFKGLHDDFNS